MRHYFTFRRKGETRDRATTIIADLSRFQEPTAHNIAANVVANACVVLSCEKERLVLVEPETQIQILAARQERVTFGGPEWCELQGRIDFLEQGRAG